MHANEDKWTQRSGLSWLTNMDDVPPRAKRFAENIDQSADLRTVEWPRRRPTEHYVTGDVLLSLLARGNEFAWPFLQGLPLGPLASVQVYSSNAHGRWQGRAHAPVFCQHHDSLRRNDDLLTLAEWLPMLTSYYEREENTYQRYVCSKCGGFSIRRISDEQNRYWHLARDLHMLRDDWDFMRREDLDEDRLSRAESSLDLLESLRTKLETIASSGTELAPVATDVRNEVDVAARRARMRAENAPRARPAPPSM